MRKFILGLLCLLFLLPVQARAETEFEVKNVPQLLAGIGSNRVVRLAPGTYNLTDMVRTTGTAARRYHNHGLFLEGLRNFKLLGSGAAKTRIVSPYETDEVLTVLDCTNIQVEGVSVGHTVQPGGCMGDAVLVSNSAGVSFVKTDLYGCGQFGLALKKVNGLVVRDSVLHDCTYGLVNAGAVRQGRFMKTRFEHKGKLAALNTFMGLDSQKPLELTFENCSFNIDPARKPFSYQKTPFIRSLLSRPSDKQNFPAAGFSFANCRFTNVKQEELSKLQKDGAKLENCRFQDDK
jgi:hypothetical protein